MRSPTEPTAEPTTEPTAEPTTEPTRESTAAPSALPLHPDDAAAELAALAAALGAEMSRRVHMGRPREAGPARAAERATPPPARAGAVPNAPKPPPSVVPLAASSPSQAPTAASPATAPRATAALAQGARDLGALAQVVAGCTACGLCQTRTQTVFADGGPRARVMFVGEAPGAEEDREGVPFVGRAGALLSDIIAKGMGLERSRDVYIANVLKCRPPDNRDPSPEERELCAPYLWRQIELVDPGVIVPLGRHAAQVVLGTDAPIGQLRGRVHRLGHRAVVPTFHPAYLLRTPAAKRETWADIRLAMAELGLQPPSAPRGGS